MNRDYERELRGLADRLERASALGMVTGILAALEMLEQNANLRLLADNLLLEFPRLN